MPPRRGQEAGRFQVQLSGEWADYKDDEDRILKRAYLSGFPNAKYGLRGQKYMVDFKNLVQENAASGKQRSIRPPHKWKPPSAPIMDPGPMTCVKVPAGAAGTTIRVPHPKDKSQFISVSVPASAKAGQEMMVPVPPLEEACAGTAVDEGSEPSAPGPAAAAAETAAKLKKEKKGWSTGAKVAAGTAGAVAVGGLVVGGAILGEHIAEEGWDATMEDVGDWAADAGEWTVGAAETVGEGIADGAEAAVDWIGGAADTAGDFIMDLF